MSRNYFTAKKLIRKHRNYLFSRQVLLGTNFLNSNVYEVFSSIIFFWYFLKDSFMYFNLYIIHAFWINLQLLKFSAHCALESFFQNVALWNKREYMNAHLREIWLILKLSRILSFYQIYQFYKFILLHHLNILWCLHYKLFNYLCYICFILCFTRNFYMLCWCKHCKNLITNK